MMLKDNGYMLESVFHGIKFPTSMAFLGPDDILVLEKNDGTVRRIVNGVMLPEPVLDVNIANSNERVMLGIAVSSRFFRLSRNKGREGSRFRRPSKSRTCPRF
jgi:hypothetical protein